MNEFLTVQQVSDKLQVHIMSIYKLIREGKLKAMRISGVGLRIEASELEKLLCQNPKRTDPKLRKTANAQFGK